jgi:hypothetical protein
VTGISLTAKLSFRTFGPRCAHATVSRRQGGEIGNRVASELLKSL